ncbi:MAG: hypothetical protein JST32_05860, partial [Bacteroidetes bacterium]|nr:hypothetical protein [Bacteroidota bacterium]
MRNLILMAALTIVFAGCQSQSSKVQAFIDGTYVNHTKGDYGVADDTLVFTHTDGAHYAILRHT